MLWGSRMTTRLYEGGSSHCRHMIIPPSLLPGAVIGAGLETSCSVVSPHGWLTPRSSLVRRPRDTVNQAVSQVGSRLKETRRTTTFGLLQRLIIILEHHFLSHGGNFPSWLCFIVGQVLLGPQRWLLQTCCVACGSTPISSSIMPTCLLLCCPQAPIWCQNSSDPSGHALIRPLKVPIEGGTRAPMDWTCMCSTYQRSAEFGGQVLEPWGNIVNMAVTCADGPVTVSQRSWNSEDRNNAPTKTTHDQSLNTPHRRCLLHWTR